LNNSNQHYEILYDLLESHTGLRLDTNRRKDVDAIIHRLSMSGEIPESYELVTFLTEQSTSHQLWQQLIQAVTIGETYFYRNSPQFEALRTQVLPALIEQRRLSERKQLRIWSAGCATGEEPYSLAILLRELLPDIENWSISILATDINEAYLATARKGVYRTRSFRNETPHSVHERWFNVVEDGYQLKPIIRNMVVFRSLNLIADHFPSFESSTMHMDVIVCRNVTIYFERETTRHLISRFHQSLDHAGWLVVGHSEPLSDLYDNFAVRNFENTVFYQKSETIISQPPVAQSNPIRSIHPPVSKPVQQRKSQEKTPLREQDIKNNTEELLTQAKRAADLEKWGEAEDWLDKAEATGQLEAQVHYLRGLVNLNCGNPEETLQLLRKAVYCEPNFAQAHYLLGDLYHKQVAKKDALRHWRWAQAILAEMDSQCILPFSDDLTVEMLTDLLAHRMSNG